MSVPCDITHYAKDGDALLSATQNRQMFDAISGRYDMLNRLLSAGLATVWRRRTVRMLSPAAGAVYLDVGCGTGDLCVEILNQQPDARVIGIDPAEAMLRIAVDKCGKQGRNTARFEAADACRLPCPADRFDGIVSGFCIRNLTDRSAAFREMSRVTRPGGRIILLELTRPHHRLLRLGHTLYARHIIPAIGRLLSHGAAYTYLTDSVTHFPDAEIVAQEMYACGIDDATIHPMTGGAATVFAGRSASPRKGGVR
jgi:demethylmenaquinone methyltransferase/2-methoxy-6-polyprenyl-1,4-benzoquinol methylase